MDLVGRDAELAAVARAVQAVRDGSSRVVAVVGEAGIGKSALLAAISARSDGLRVASGRAAEHERDLPFSLAAVALAHHARAIDPSIAAGACPPAPANAAERYRQHRNASDLIERLGPLVLLFDDVQWADDASLELILHLLSRPPATPHLLVFALRPCAPATRLLAAARHHPGFEQLAPAPLDDAAACALLGDIPDRERVLRAGAGIPLYLRELARAADVPGSEGLPATLQAAIEREVEALGEDERALLRGAAVAGDPFDPELAAAAATSDGSLSLSRRDPSLDALVAADLVRPHAQTREFTFRHPLVRRAIYDAAPPAWRLAAHERVAAVLEARGAAPAKHAYHVARFARAGDDEAVAVLRRAAEAASRSSPATAANWYAAALALVRETARGELLGPLARSLASAGRLEESLDRLREALELDPGDLELTLTCARVEGLRGRPGDGVRRLEAAYAAQPHPRLAFELAAAAMTATDAPALRTWASTTERLAGADAVLVAAARVLATVARAWDGDPVADQLGMLGAFDDDALNAHPTVLLHASRALLRLERTDDAAALLKRAIEIARRTSSGEMLVWLLGLQAQAHWLQLDLDQALVAAEAAEATARMQGAPNPLLLALSVRAAIHHDRGEPPEAARAAADCVALIAEVEPSAATRMAAAVLAALDVTQEPERCLAVLAILEDGALDPSWAARCALLRVRAAIASDRVEDADRLARAAAAQAASVTLPLAAIRAETARAEVLLARGEPRAAAALAEATAGAVEGRPARARVFNPRLARAAAEAAPTHRHRSALDAAEARLVHGRALAAAGEPERAKAVLQRLAADLARGGAQRLMAATARELRALGTRVSADARRHEKAELSQREREIALLVASGSSNKQVAARLYLSEKTVENALTRVYAKVGVRSRVQLARAWAAG